MPVAGAWGRLAAQDRGVTHQLQTEEMSVRCAFNTLQQNTLAEEPLHLET